jgi:hypothetical protein
MARTISVQVNGDRAGEPNETFFVFTVTLSPASDVAVGLNFASANGSAISPEDYNAVSGSLTFAAGQTSRTVTVAVKGDKKKEGQELHYVNLTGAAGAFVTDSQGTGIIRNDD